jgi:hypothetical protein
MIAYNEATHLCLMGHQLWLPLSCAKTIHVQFHFLCSELYVASSGSYFIQNRDKSLLPEFQEYTAPTLA